MLWLGPARSLGHHQLPQMEPPDVDMSVCCMQTSMIDPTSQILITANPDHSMVGSLQQHGVWVHMGPQSRLGGMHPCLGGMPSDVSAVFTLSHHSFDRLVISKFASCRSRHDL